MRVVCLVVLFGLCRAQFDFFSRSNYEDSYNSLSDAIGMKDAIGVWGRAFRNLITRHKLPPGSLNHKEYTIKPEVTDIEALRNVQIQGGNDKIINEKILYALLPRIKGQSAFTTTPMPTTPTTSTTTTTKPTTTTATTTTTTEPSTTTVKITEKEEITIKSTERTKVTSPIDTTEATTEEETTVLPLPKSKDGNSGGPQFTVVFRTRDKELREVKKAGVEVRETDFNTDKESETTTVEEEDTTTTTAPKKPIAKIVSKKPVEPKKAEQAKQKKEATKTTAVAPKMDKQEDVLAKNVLKQKELMEDDDISTTVWTEDTTEASIEGSGERDVVEATEPMLLSQETTKPAKNAAVIKTTTKKPTTTPKKIDEKKDKNEKKVEKVEKKKDEKKEDKKEKPKTEKKKEDPKKKDEKKKEQKKTEKKPPNSKEVEAQIEREATEILELLNKPAQDRRQELSRKVLFEKLKEYLAKQESTTIRPKVTATTTTPAPEKAANEEKPEKAAAQNNEEKADDPTVKSNNKDTFSLPLSTTEPSETQSTTMSAPSTTVSTTTTDEIEVKKTFSVKKSLKIPEAEEDDPNAPAFIQEDVPVADNSTVTVVETTTTLARATSAVPGSTVYNLNANSNSDTHPVLTNVMTPIAGILDGISPILVPLLSTTGQAARARARGIRTYEPTGKDIMVDSPGETSIVGFGTQLAREILSPGILKRERQARERAMAAKIEEARRARESKSLFATILDVARTGPPLELPFISTPKPQLYGQGLPVAASSSNYVPAPPPGYNGPPAPPPPPPPPGFLPRGYNGPIPEAFRPTNSPVLQIDGASDQTRNTPYYPPVLETSTFKNDEGYQMGRSGVRTTFQEDSGLQMSGNGVVLGDRIPEMPEIMIAPAGDSAPPSPSFPVGSGGGFGGGRKPTGSFEEAEKNSRMDSSFITARKRL